MLKNFALCDALRAMEMVGESEELRANIHEFVFLTLFTKLFVLIENFLSEFKQNLLNAWVIVLKFHLNFCCDSHLIL